MADDLYGKYTAIDTANERARLNYKPSFKYEPKKEYVVSFQTEEIIEDKDQSDSYEATEPITLQYEQFVDTWDTLNNLILVSEEKIADIKVPITIDQANKLLDSSPQLDPLIVQQGYIDFATYMNTFTDSESPGNSLIQDIVQSYAEDVGGSLELEFYEDLRELKALVNEGYFLFKETLLKKYLYEGVPSQPVVDENFLSVLDAAIQEASVKNEKVKKAYEGAEVGYYESLRTEYGQPSFFKISEVYTKAKRAYDLVLRDEKGITEMLDVTSNILSGAIVCTNLIKSGLVIGGDVEEKEVMNLIENQTTSNEELAELMHLSQIALKLQVNQQIEDKKQYRDVLHNINSLSRKQRAGDELLNAYELRNQLYLKMYDILQHLESPSKSIGVEAFLNQLAGGLSVIQEQYDTFIREVYVMYSNEFDIRAEKISKVMEKENARNGYSIVSEY